MRQDTSYVRQCRLCGEQRGGALGKKDALAELRGIEPSPFDRAISEQWQTRRDGVISEYSSVRKQLELLKLRRHAPEQASMVQSARAKEELAQRSIADAIRVATEAVGSERAMHLLLSELNRESAEKRRAIELQVDRFRSEPELREWLDGWLAEDFDVQREVVGRHLTESVEVKVDYVLFPKKHLIEAGFKAVHVGLEVKYLNQDSGFSHKAYRTVWQAVSYTDSEFYVHSRGARLGGMLLFTNLSFAEERELLRFEAVRRGSDGSEWRAMLGIANHAGVGVLQVHGSRRDWRGWRISFGSGAYFNRTKAKGRANYFAGNRGLLGKVRIGNF